MFEKERSDFLESRLGLFVLGEISNKVQGAKTRISQSDVGWEEVLFLRGKIRALSDMLEFLMSDLPSDKNEEE